MAWNIPKLRGREKVALEAYYADLTGWSGHVALSALGRGNESAADEIASIALSDFLAVYVHRVEPRGSDDIDRRVVVRFIGLVIARRAHRLAKRLRQSDPLDDQPQGVESVETADEDFLRFREFVPGCLERLRDPKAKTAITLKYARDLDNPEIGERLSVSQQYIGKLIKKSLELLRKCVTLRAREQHHGHA